MTLPEIHTSELCPACSADIPCRVVTTGHARYWANFRASPEVWGPILRRDAEHDRDHPPKTPLLKVPQPPRAVVGPRVPRDPADPRPRAVLVTPSLNIGGADRWMIALMRETAARVKWVTVACTMPDNVVPAIRAEVDALAKTPATVGDWHVGTALDSADVVVAWGVDLGWLAALAGPRNVPIVGVSHGVGEWTSGLFSAPDLASALVAVAPAGLRTFPEASRARAVVIENCVEPWRLEPRSDLATTRAAWGVECGQKAIVQVGRLSPEKNPESIADAVAELHRRGHTEWRGVHVGTGWREAEVRAHAEAVAPGLIRFPGVTDDVAAAYLSADALTLPSSEEACSLMQLEAFWVGAPLIASTIGLTEEPEIAALCRTVRPGCSGAELADAVLADEADPEGTIARAARATDIARERFTPERFGRRWSDLIAAAARAVRPVVAPAYPGFTDFSDVATRRCCGG